MDKETLSNYGWITICVLVLAVMIALATPFGSYVKSGVENTATGLVETSNKGIDVALLSTGTPKPPIIRNGIIPDGATYTPNGGTALTGNGTNTFPDTISEGDTYEEEDYIYKYNQYYSGSSWKSDTSQNGWGVRVKDNTKTSYGAIISEIAGQPITNMPYTFQSCTSLTTAPTIPNSVKSMVRTFSGCTSLTTAPAIPNSVTKMYGTFAWCSSLTTAPNMSNASSVTDISYTFYDCTSLTSAPTIPNKVTNMEYTFYDCTSLTTAPAIPNSVKGMSNTFNGCTKLTTAPKIPNSVTNMMSTFWSCKSLTGTIEVNANPTYYDYCLKSTKITSITGSCSQETKNNLMSTK